MVIFILPLMKSVLENQYALTQKSREVVFNFIETDVAEGLFSPVAAYGNRTIKDLLEHNAQCYIHWLVYFTLSKPVGSMKELDFTTLENIRLQYNRVDNIVADFLQSFDGKMDIPIKRTHTRNGQLSASPFQLFTHVLTHEFHHKGQILSMGRMLGHIPPDTDVSIFFEMM